MKRCFEAVYGMPVSRYLRRVRIRRAAALLRSTDDTVLSVAGQVGYSNGSKFAAAFKAEMGVNPSNTGGQKNRNRRITRRPGTEPT